MNIIKTTLRGHAGPPTLLFGLILLIGCGSEPPALTIGDVEFSERDLVGYNGARRTRLAELTAFGLAVSSGEAGEMGAPLIERRTRESLLEALQQEVTLRLAGLDEAALRARYRDSPEFELTVRHLVVLVPEWASEAEEAEAREKAQAALDRIRGGEDFGAVAGQVSEEPGASARGGLLEPGRKGSWVDEFWQAASGLEVGGVSPVIRTEYGFHVIKLEDRTPIPFDEARRTFVARMSGLVNVPDQAMQDWTDSVSAGMEVDSAALEAAYQEAGSLFVLADRVLPEENPELVLARWEGGSYSASQLSRHLLSQDRPSWEHLAAGGSEELTAVATDGARRALLARVAESMGVRLSAAVEEGHRREWEGAVQGWAQTLGFSEGMGPDAVRTNALAVVAATGQAVSLARGDVRNWAPMILSFYPIGPEAE